jgi:hypothetical protein
LIEGGENDPAHPSGLADQFGFGSLLDGSGKGFRQNDADSFGWLKPSLIKIDQFGCS